MTRIFYFSGTGNSYFIAKKLSTTLPNCMLTSMYSVLKTENFECFDEIIGFVFPVHAFSMPKLVKKFLEKIRVKPDAYIFAIATRGGSPCNVFKEINAILGKQSKFIDAQWFINMVNNYLTMFDVPSDVERQKIKEEADNRLSEVAEAVRARKVVSLKDYGDPFEKNVLFPILSRLYKNTNYFGLQKKFYADNKCTDCGLCEKVCLSGKISCASGCPVWDKSMDCEYCFACIQFCPNGAIQLKGTKTPKRKRYHHEEVSANEVAAQKNSDKRKLL